MSDRIYWLNGLLPVRIVAQRTVLRSRIGGGWVEVTECQVEHRYGGMEWVDDAYLMGNPTA